MPDAPDPSAPLAVVDADDTVVFAITRDELRRLLAFTERFVPALLADDDFVDAAGAELAEYLDAEALLEPVAAAGAAAAGWYGGSACQGCGREDPAGIHYADCPLLEPGDLILDRGQDEAEARPQKDDA